MSKRPKKTVVSIVLALVTTAALIGTAGCQPRSEPPRISVVEEQERSWVAAEDTSPHAEDVEAESESGSTLEASGGQAPEEQAPEAENAGEMRPALRQALEDGAKLVAITFDDGPYPPSTQDMLELLRQEEVKATFFLVGKNVATFPELAREVAQDGHQIGNHTYNHKLLPDLTAEEFENEVGGNNRLIEETTGARPTVLRPPGGRLSDEMNGRVGMPLFLWSVDPRDWDSTDEDAIYQHVVDNTGDGDIIIMHDVYMASVKAAARIIPELKERGFFFVTVEELAALRGELVNGQVYRSFPPAESADEPPAPPAEETLMEESQGEIPAENIAPEEASNG